VALLPEPNRKTEVFVLVEGVVMYLYPEVKQALLIFRDGLGKASQYSLRANKI
jgi:O-methyltransferase involved in polyketide biosynthesis